MIRDPEDHIWYLKFYSRISAEGLEGRVRALKGWMVKGSGPALPAALVDSVGDSWEEKGANTKSGGDQWRDGENWPPLEAIQKLMPAPLQPN